MPVADRRRATRERVIAAAGPLFVERGYREATMSDLARAAAVSVQTLYLAFGGKAAVLEAVLTAADEGQGPPAAGASAAAEPDGPALLARHVEATAAAVERRYPLDTVLRAAAADPEPAALLAAARAATLDAHARAVDELADRPGFTTRLSLQRATDVVAALLAPQTYELLVVQGGWTTPDWAEWATAHLVNDLFPAPGPAAR